MERIKQLALEVGGLIYSRRQHEIDARQRSEELQRGGVDAVGNMLPLDRPPPMLERNPQQQALFQRIRYGPCIEACVCVYMAHSS